MKKIINGKRYDTETAKEVACDSYLYPRDFNYWSETLYRKNTGEYFLYGEGGPMSKYAESTGQNQWTGGERIIPLSLEAAKEWAEKHLDGAEYEEIFGAVEEDESKKVVTFSLPESVIELIKQGSQNRKMTLSDYVAEAVKAYK